jgi:hypothetical protein
MKANDAILLQGLLKVARSNIERGRTDLNTVAWPAEMVGISSSIRSVMLALDQTINALDRVLEDLK